MLFILRTQRVEKSLLEISRLNLSKDFGGVLKTYFGELKKPFFSDRSNSHSMVHTNLI
jgi:hypothetical protein